MICVFIEADGSQTAEAFVVEKRQSCRNICRYLNAFCTNVAGMSDLASGTREDE